MNGSQILREVGLPAYTRGLAVLSEGDCESFRILSDRIQKHHVGPDSYYKEYEGGGAASNYKVSYFGNAWWIPFPPSLVRPGFFFLRALKLTSILAGPSIRRWLTGRPYSQRRFTPLYHSKRKLRRDEETSDPTGPQSIGRPDCPLAV